jgi:hypothetical protein
MADEPKADSRVIPAQLSHLAIYNPSFGPTDETFREQLVCYYSRKTEPEQDSRSKNEPLRRGADDEKLRQIGLAQGVVNFAK